MNWLRNFMYGRNGVDHLAVFSVVLGLFISVVTSFMYNPFLRLIPTLPYGYAFFRVMSRNIPKRQAENRNFLNIWYGLKNKVRLLKSRSADKAYKYYTCPSCRASLRVPRGKGKIIITCPRCRHEMSKKT